ncbi:MAG TPA: hypothetical protein VK671_02230 [Mucilaginibacter sp.]|jgi:hypothetical protein|nr:hypothetical protein [Mucilaginibacter sp.]
MKKLSLLPLLCVVLLTSCTKKTETTPEPNTANVVSTQITQPAAAKPDTIPDGAIVKIKLQMDSASLDETLLEFKHSASGNYSSSQDAIYFQGFGIGSLSSRTCDGVYCAIQAVPFVPGKAIPLKVTTQKDGVYLLKTSYTKNIPPDKGIWLKDAYRKDSLNLRIWNYRFDVIKSDTNSFGVGRFSVVVR